MALTDTSIRRLPAVSKETYMGDGNNLYLKISPRTQSKTWVFRVKVNGATRKTTLGEFPAMPVAAARAAAAALHLAPKFTPSSVLSVVDDFYKVVESNWKIKKNLITYTNKMKSEFGHRQIGSLTRKDFVEALGAYAKTAPVAANHCRSLWVQVLEYAYERGLVPVNVLKGTSNRIAGGKETPRDRVLTTEEIICVLKGKAEPYKILRCLLRTGCRIGELQSAQAPQMADSLGEGIRLLIPENKSAREHWVYLSPSALADCNIAKGTMEYGPFLFKPVSYAYIQQYVKRLDRGWTPHDLRRTFATLMAELGAPVHIIEKCLNHSLGGVAAVYNRAEYEGERIDWTQKLSDYLDDLVKENGS